MELVASDAGTFSFPSQEPPYAIVATHELGFAVAVAEEFARDPVLRLQLWGRVEITADGAAPAEGSIPFYIQFPDLPKDAQNMPWISIHPEAKRTAETGSFSKNFPRERRNSGATVNPITMH